MIDRRLSAGSWLCIPFALYAILAPFLLLLPSHAFDKSWPDHARFHLLWASGKLFAIGTNQYLLVRYGLRSGKPWVWYALASNLIFGGMTIVPASRIAHGPIPPFQSHDRSTKLAVFVFLSGIVGLALSFPALKSARR